MGKVTIAVLMVCGLAAGQKALTDIPFTRNCGAGVQACPPPEPMEVPAIQEKRDKDTEPSYPMSVIGMCYQYDEKEKRCMAGSIDAEATSAQRQEWAILHANWVERQKHKTRWTCADKTRILEHDEQTAPTYWCRKVVSRGTPESESK